VETDKKGGAEDPGKGAEKGDRDGGHLGEGSYKANCRLAEINTVEQEHYMKDMAMTYMIMQRKVNLD
jgi:hypothetical protein